MKFDYFKKKTVSRNHAKHISQYASRIIQNSSTALLWFSAILGILILVKIGGFFVTSVKAERLVAKVMAQSKPDPNDTEKYFAKARTMADELKQKNLFAPSPPKRHPVKEVSGILGNEVLIKGKWYKVGDKVADARIVAIEPAQVRIEWEGKEKTFAPIGASSAPRPKNKIKKPNKTDDNLKKPEVRPEKPAEETTTAPPEEDPLAWMGVKLSPALRAKMLEQWNKLSDEQKEKMKEQWNKMSDEEKQNTIDQMEQNL